MGKRPTASAKITTPILHITYLSSTNKNKINSSPSYLPIYLNGFTKGWNLKTKQISKWYQFY